MIISLHFQFAKKEPTTIDLDIPGRVKQGNAVWLSEAQRRKIREAYRKVFHRPIDGMVFTFHTGKVRPTGPLDRPANHALVGINGNINPRSFNYESRERYRIIIPTGNRKHLWTNGRRARVFRHRPNINVIRPMW